MYKKFETTGAVTDLTDRQDNSSGTRNLSQDLYCECWHNLTMIKSLVWTCLPWNNKRRNYATRCLWWFSGPSDWYDGLPAASHTHTAVNRSRSELLLILEGRRGSISKWPAQ